LEFRHGSGRRGRDLSQRAPISTIHTTRAALNSGAPLAAAAITKSTTAAYSSSTAATLPFATATYTTALIAFTTTLSPVAADGIGDRCM